MPNYGIAGSAGTLRAGTAGEAGRAGKSGSGAGGNGGKGGDSQGGAGGQGGNGGGGAGGSGGTIRLSASELTVLSATFDTTGGQGIRVNGNSFGTSTSGIISLAANSRPAATYTKAANDSVIQPNGPQGTNPFFSGTPQTPYIASLLSGGAVAGIASGVNVSQIINPATLPPRTIAALVLVTSVPGNSLVSPSNPAVALVNLGSANLSSPAMGLGAAGFTAPLQSMGWSTDPRFGGSGPLPLGQLTTNQTYLTMIPAGPSPTIAKVVATYQGVTYSISSTSFGAGSPLLIILCPTDLNGDSLVDDSDFVIFLASYNTLDCADPTMPAGCPSDFNRDGLVDDADFVVFLAAYNELICP